MSHLKSVGFAIGAAFTLCLSNSALSQRGSAMSDASKFVGSWRLVETTDDGKVRIERGANATGIITYHQSGWMAAQIQPDRDPVKMKGAEPTGEEAKAALFGYTAYFGNYTVDEKAKTVTHHRKASVSPGWDRRPDFVRAYEFVGEDRVILRPVGNKHELIWERLK
jgi:hypothetical protein